VLVLRRLKEEMSKASSTVDKGNQLKNLIDTSLKTNILMAFQIHNNSIKKMMKLPLPRLKMILMLQFLKLLMFLSLILPLLRLL
jgi:hypothetical protein